jgi:hypothetical protein
MGLPAGGAECLYSPALIDYVKGQLRQAGVRGKVIPPDDVITKHARTAYEGHMASLVEQVLAELVPLDTIKRAIVEQFRERVTWSDMRPWIETALQETPTAPWRRAAERKIEVWQRFGGNWATLIERRFSSGIWIARWDNGVLT